MRLDDPAEVLVDSGLVDVDFVAAQLGTRFDSVYEAARAAVQAGEVSPHPLFEAQWIGRRRSWQRSGQHPVLWYVSERRRRNRIAPHPLVDPRIIFAAHARGPAPPLRRPVLLALGVRARHGAADPDPAQEGVLGDLPRRRDRGGDRVARGGRARATRAASGPTPELPATARHLPGRHRGDGRPGLRPARAGDRRLAAGADLRRLAPRRGGPRVARRHRLRCSRAWRPSTTGSPWSASRAAGTPGRSTPPSSTAPPSTSPSSRRAASGCPRCSPSCSPTPTTAGAAAVLAGAGAVGRVPPRAGRRPAGRPHHLAAASYGDQGRRRLRRVARRVGRARPAAAAHPRPRARRPSTYPS